MDAYFPIAMCNVTIEDLELAQRIQDCMDSLQAKLEDCFEKHVKPLQESMKVKTEFRVCIMTITRNGHYRYYLRHADDYFIAEDIVNRFILNIRTCWIRVLMYKGNGVWQEISFIDCRIPQSEYKLPL